VAQQNPHRVDLGNALVRYLGERMTFSQLDSAMGWTSGKASRVADGKRTLSERDVLGLAHVLDLSNDDIEELQRLASLSRKRKANQFIADYATSYVSFEQDAAGIDAYSDLLIPGIAQSAVYATAVLSSAGSTNVAEQVAARLDRQKILCAEDSPRVRIVVGEAALHHLVGGLAGLRQQLEHMLTQLDMGRIELAIDRFASGAHQGLGSRFNIVRRANGDERVYIESALTSVYLHEEDDVAAHQRIFDRVWERAAKADESATILRKRIQQLA
jgi:plasmid maintenance system antidote protein VapI